MPTLSETVAMEEALLSFRKTRIQLFCLLPLLVFPLKPRLVYVMESTESLSRHTHLLVWGWELWVIGGCHFGQVAGAIILWIAATILVASSTCLCVQKADGQPKNNEPRSTILERGFVVQTKVCDKTWSCKKQASHRTKTTSAVFRLFSSQPHHTQAINSHTTTHIYIGLHRFVMHKYGHTQW